MHIISCHYCDTDFVADDWVNGKCPNCKSTFWWEELITTNDGDDFEDYIPIIQWENKYENF